MYIVSPFVWIRISFAVHASMTHGLERANPHRVISNGVCIYEHIFCDILSTFLSTENEKVDCSE